MLLGKLEECTQQGNEFWKKIQKIMKTREKEALPEPVAIRLLFKSL